MHAKITSLIIDDKKGNVIDIKINYCDLKSKTFYIC